MSMVGSIINVYALGILHWAMLSLAVMITMTTSAAAIHSGIVSTRRHRTNLLTLRVGVFHFYSHGRVRAVYVWRKFRAWQRHLMPLWGDVVGQRLCVCIAYSTSSSGVGTTRKRIKVKRSEYSLEHRETLGSSLPQSWTVFPYNDYKTLRLSEQTEFPTIFHSNKGNQDNVHAYLLCAWISIWFWLTRTSRNCSANFRHVIFPVHKIKVCCCTKKN